jgi:hypothetical protein
MGWGHPAGRHLTTQANTAHQALTVAAGALDQAVLPGAALRGDAGRIELVSNLWARTQVDGKLMESGTAELGGALAHRPDPTAR